MSSHLDLENMSVEEVCEWLKDNSFSEAILDDFKEEEMDGNAILQAFATCSGPDCLRDVVKKFGYRVKVYNFIKSAISNQIEPPSSSRCSTPITPISRSMGEDSDHDTVSLNNTVSSCGSGTPSSSRKNIVKRKLTVANQLPKPFPIPIFRRSTMLLLEDKKYTTDDRKYMVRVLATMLLASVEKATMGDCATVAQALTAKYPFLGDYRGWQGFIYTRCQNTNRMPCKKAGEPPEKRKKKDQNHYYPALGSCEEDEESYSRNIALLQKELQNKRPNSSAIKSLMVRTFSERRKEVLDGGKMVSTLCEEYPFLKRETYLAQEMDCVIQRDNSAIEFKATWEQYSVAIINFAEQHKKNKDLLNCFRDYDDDSDVDNTLTALRCLGYFLGSKSKKKCAGGNVFTDVHGLLMESPLGTPLEEAVDSEVRQPHIIRIIDSQIFVCVEGGTFIECRDLSNAIYTMIAAHYVFDIEYYSKVSDIHLFLQEKVLGLIDQQGKRSSTFLSTAAGIQCHLETGGEEV